MTATNHALTGALIGLSINTPILALSVALASHFVCDALPHFGAGKNSIQRGWFKGLLIIEAAVCVLIVLTLALAQPVNWLLSAVCAFVATSPDFMWIDKFLKARNSHPSQARPSILLRFHAAIQWFERPIGALFEVAWAISAIILLKVYIT